MTAEEIKKIAEDNWRIYVNARDGGDKELAEAALNWHKEWMAELKKLEG